MRKYQWAQYKTLWCFTGASFLVLFLIRSTPVPRHYRIIKEIRSTYVNFTMTNVQGIVPTKICSRIPPGLLGYLPPSAAKLYLPPEGRLWLKEKRLKAANKDLAMGGIWTPAQCRPVHSIAIIIPFRNRSSHLLVLLNNLLPVIKRQLVQFRIFVIEQAGNDSFNKGRLMNIGYRFIKTEYSSFSRCIIFHDVDLIPENDFNMYTCGRWPKHMSPSVSTLNYELPYEQLVGGVLAITDHHFEKANGFSNLYYGWGGEDDDFYYSLKLLNAVTKRYQNDGLAQLDSYKYKILSASMKNLFTHLLVDIGLRIESFYNVVPRTSKMDTSSRSVQENIAYGLYAVMAQKVENDLLINKLRTLIRARDMIIINGSLTNATWA